MLQMIYINFYESIHNIHFYNSSASAEISDRVKLHRKCLFTHRRPVVTTGDSFWSRMALKLVITTLACMKLVTTLWRFASPEKSYCKKWSVYA